MKELLASKTNDIISLSDDSMCMSKIRSATGQGAAIKDVIIFLSLPMRVLNTSKQVLQTNHPRASFSPTQFSPLFFCLGFFNKHLLFFFSFCAFFFSTELLTFSFCFLYSNIFFAEVTEFCVLTQVINFHSFLLRQSKHNEYHIYSVLAVQVN